MDITENSFEGFEILSGNNRIENWKIIEFINEQSKFCDINATISETKEIINNSGLGYNHDFDFVISQYPIILILCILFFSLSMGRYSLQISSSLK